jgi:uncharacterized protein (TIGR00369 family)
MTERTRVVTWEDPQATAGAARGRTGLEFLQAWIDGDIPAPPISATMGFSLARVERGTAVFTGEVGEFHFNPIGSVHGGVYATLLDSACGCSVQTMLDAGVGYTSIDLSVKFLRGARLDSGLLTCTGTVTHLGRRTALAEARIVDAAGTLLATATSSCLILAG